MLFTQAAVLSQMLIAAVSNSSAFFNWQLSHQSQCQRIFPLVQKVRTNFFAEVGSVIEEVTLGGNFPS